MQQLKNKHSANSQALVALALELYRAPRGTWPPLNRLAMPPPLEEDPPESLTPSVKIITRRGGIRRGMTSVLILGIRT
jgi:hypothetical protein